MKRLVLLLVLMIGIVSAEGQELYGQRKTLFEVLPVDSTDIVFLGNSLTQGCEWHELFGMPNLKNRGINGDIIQGVRDRVDPVVAGHPKKIFLLTGVNDISHHIPADSLARAMGELVDYILEKSPTTKLYLESCLPINNDFRRYKNLFGEEENLLEFNRLLEKLAADRGVTFLNLFPLFANEEGKLDPSLTNDGLHLLGAGYLRWRDFLLPYVLE